MIQKEDLFLKLPFEYQGRIWKDYMCEALAYKVYTMMRGAHSVLKQEVGLISGYGKCAVSKNFCDEGESVISFYRTKDMYALREFSGNPFKLFSEMLRVAREGYGVDLENYLVTIIVMDYLLCNEDRHWNNMDFVKSSGGMRVSVLYDFGLSLFEHDCCYIGKSLQEALQLVGGKPFAKDLGLPVMMLLNRGYEKIIKRMVADIEIPDINEFPNELGYEYFKYALNHLRGV